MSKPRHAVIYVLYMAYCFGSGTGTKFIGVDPLIALLILMPLNLWLGLYLNKKGYFG